MNIQPSETNRSFNTGAVRGEDGGRGKPSLLPMTALALLGRCFGGASQMPWGAIMDVAKVFEAGAAKYAARNWEKGIPMHAYVDSAMRHFAKFMQGHEDEPHCTQFAWNLLCLLQTHLWLHWGERPYDLYERPDDPKFITLPNVDLSQPVLEGEFIPVPFGLSMNDYADLAVGNVALYLDGRGLGYLFAAVGCSLCLLQAKLDFDTGMFSGIHGGMNQPWVQQEVPDPFE